MKQKLLFFMAFFLPCLAFAQNGLRVKGNVIGAVSSEPVPGVIVSVTDSDIQTTTNADGTFILRGLKPGRYVLSVMDLISKIQQKEPDLEITPIGEPTFIITYISSKLY